MLKLKCWTGLKKDWHKRIQLKKRNWQNFRSHGMTKVLKLSNPRQKSTVKPMNGVTKWDSNLKTE